VAAANGIDDPMRLRPGNSVMLPAVDELPSGDLANAAGRVREVVRGA
jgi:hypothetical protein